MPNTWSIGRYEVTALIGKGGMGTVYRARDPRSGREVAIKLLRQGEATQNPELLSRFVREIKLARSLSHPNVVTVLDDGEHEGLPYFVMEFVSGETLEAVIKRAVQLPLVSKLRLMEEVCAGLAHAHQANIVHRDIKPANLMVGPDGAVKILDFGIARPLDSSMTLHGVVMGTPNYMSPEQARGDAVDAGTDIFAAGAVLYELIASRKAFPGDGYEEVRRRILNSTPIRLDEACPGIDPRLLDIVDQALEKSRDRRFKSIAVLQSSLAGVRLSMTEATRRPGGASGSDVGVLTPPVGATPRSAADRENIAKQHERHIAIRLAAAEQALKSGDPEAAIKSCGQALMLSPADAKAAALLERAYQAVEDRQVEQWIAQARKQVGAGALTEAGRAIDAAAGVNPGHPDVVALQREIAERRRDETIRAAIGKARALVDAGDPGAARREVDRALAIDAQSAEALALSATIDRALADARERARIEAGLAEASRRFAARDYAAALTVLERLQPTADPRVSETLDRLRHSFEAIEEQRRTEAVRAGLARARASFDQGDHVAALREIEQVLSQGPAEAEAADAGTLKATIARALAAKLERERLMAAVNAARRKFAEGAHDTAIRMIENIQPASDPLVIAGLEELTRARHALAERQRTEAERAERLERQHRVAKLIDEARALIEAQSFETAQTRLDAARAIDAAHPEIEVLWNRAQDAAARREQQRREAEAEALRLEEQRRAAAAEVQRLEAVAEAQRQDEQRREERQRRKAEAERQRQRRREAAAEARRQEQPHREIEPTLRREPPPAPEPTLKQPASEPTLKRPAARAKDQRQAPATKPDRSADYAQRPVIDAHISQAAKFAQRREFRMAIVELEAALAIKPDHTGLTTLLAKMREAEANRQRDVGPPVTLGEMALQKDRPVDATPPRAVRVSSLTSRFSKTTLIAWGAIVILVIAVLILVLSNR